MNCKHFVSLGFILINSFWASAQNLPEKSAIVHTLRKVNEYWMAQNPTYGNREWARAVYYTGNLELYKAYPHLRYKAYAEEWAALHNWSLSGGDWTDNADQHCAGQVYLDLFLMDDIPDTSKIERIRTTLSNMIARDDNDAWWWIDALYMAMPSFVRLGNIEEDTTYFNHMYELYTDTKVDRGLYNEAVGLWYRDESFLPPYTTPNGEDSYWSRGNGWVFAAHVRTLEELPKTDPHYQEYLDTFIKMAEALKLRQRADGFWNVSLNDADDFGGPETSGTAFFTYGMAWGIDNDILSSEEYLPVISRAWSGLSETALHANGYLGYIQGVGVAPFSSQPVTFQSNEDFGVGAFLMAGAELLQLASGELPEPPSFWALEATADSVNRVRVAFNQPVEESSGTAIANYSIDGFTVLEASVNGSEVTLELAEPLVYGVFELAITEVKSFEGEALEEMTIVDFSYHDLQVLDYSSYEWGSSNVPENTLDLNYGTRWSAEGDGEWILYDLGGVQVLDSLGLAFYNGRNRQAFIDIEVSKDMTTFHSIFSGPSGGNTLGLEYFGNEARVARYVRVTGYGNSQSDWNSITEVHAAMSDLTTPRAISLSATEITTDEIGSVVAFLSTEDADVGDEHTYELLEQSVEGMCRLEGEQLILLQAVSRHQEDLSITVASTDMVGHRIDSTFTLSVQLPDPLEEEAFASSVYPNPVMKGNWLKWSCEECSAELMNELGQVVRPVRGQQIDITNLKGGLYLLKLSNGRATKVHKVLVE